MNLLISNGAALAKTLKELIKKHEQFSFAVAWAGVNHDVYDTVRRNREKIRRGVIGTHFYQTHPAVLKDFVASKKVRFVTDTGGVFHPKAYLFWTDGAWDALIGSANLTGAAMEKNQELMLHTSGSSARDAVRKRLADTFRAYWNDAVVMETEWARNYRAMWHDRQSAIRRLSGDYSRDKRGKKGTSPLKTKIMTKSWNSFLANVNADRYHGVKKRCDLLGQVRGYFSKFGELRRMPPEERKVVAGLPSAASDEWGWFGSMKGAGYFKNAIKDSAKLATVSKALGHIPLVGAVSRRHYDAFTEGFQKAFPRGGSGVAVASRLLAMKRPDYFVCIDSKNKRALCQDFGIPQVRVTLESYWDEIVCRILDSVWWNAPEPRAGVARRVWQGRAAMLDAIFYEE